MPSFWQSSTVYTLNTRVVDNNGNLQQVIVAGASGLTSPTWATTLGTTTPDNSITWKLVGYQTIQIQRKPIGPVQEIPSDVISVSTGSSDAGKIVTLSSSGLLDPSVIPSGTGAISVTTVTSNYTVLVTDFLIFVNSTTAVALTVPDTSYLGQTFRIKNINTGVVTIAGVTGTIDGQASVQLSLQYQSLDLEWNGTNYFIV
jgi:hypothetical protein